MKVDEVAKRYKKLLLAIGIGGFIFLLTALAMTFMHNYELLQDSLSLERTVYISELSAQPETFSEAAALLSMGKRREAGQDFFVDAEGNVYTPEGEPYALKASAFLVRLLYDREEADSFERNDRGEESWIFGCPVEQLVIDGIEIKALLKSYDASAFKSSFAMELFDQNGYSFIVNKQGAIVIGAQTMQDYGYNLFSGFREKGMEEAFCRDIEEHIREGESGQMYVSFDDTDWLLQFDLLQNREQYIFVMVPVSVTAAMPFFYMNRTLIMGLLARSARAKSDFMSRMSHDIRTPLNAIIGMNYIAREQLNDREKVRDCLSKMEFSASYLLELINDMLDMQKIESGKMVLSMEPFSLRELMESHESVLRPNMEKKGLQFEVQGMEELTWNYVGDKLRISRILMNLLGNAFKFTPAGGCVALAVQVRPMDGRLDQVIFTVKDTGIGMSREYMEHLFQPFEQENGGSSQFGGSGLGLSIVYNLVRLMNGEIKVESEQGAASCFRVTLFLQRDVQDISEAGVVRSCEEAGSRISMAGKRILLVEDNDLNREIAKTILEMRGLTVEAEENGRTALERFEACEPGYFDAVITDVRMPVMDGHQLARAIRSGGHPDGADIPILAMSANAFAEDIQAALEAGMNAHLSKPIIMEELEAALQKYLGDPRV